MNDVTFGTWSAASSPLTIEYSLVVIEEIRHEVAEGFQKLSRGGIEVGGVLYGVHDGQTVRVMAIRPAACEHASGPTFRLSEKDRAALHEQIRQDQADSRLEDLVCVGWYVSHTRTEIMLTESDQEIFASFFGKPWQVTLVVRPSRGGNMRAGFFVRDGDGTVNANQSLLEFNFPDRLAAVFENRGENRGDRRRDNRGASAERPAPEPRGLPRAPRIVPTSPTSFPPSSSASSPASSQPSSPASSPPSSPASSPPSSPASSPPTPASLAARAPEPPPEVRSFPQPAPVRSSSSMTSLFGQPVPAQAAAPAFEPAELADPAPANKSLDKKWIWLAAALIIVAGLAVTGSRFLASGGTNETLALSVLEREGQLDIEWNRQAAPVSRAVSGTLEIADGPQNRTIPLKAADLALGKFSYKRDTGDIQVRMIVDQPNGEKVQEASRFLGPAPPKANDDELKTLQQRRDELQTEVDRLKKSNDQQAERIQQLERTLKILQTRQGN